MDLIRSFHAKLRSLAITLDSETARLQRALDGEESGECGVGRRGLRGSCDPPGRPQPAPSAAAQKGLHKYERTHSAESVLF